MKSSTVTRVAPFNVDAIDCVAGRATIFGREHDVLHLDGAGYRVLAQMEAAKSVDLDVMQGLVGSAVPSLSDEELGRLRPQQLGAVLAIAAGAIKEVEAETEAFLPNGDSPATAKRRARGSKA